MLPMLLVIRVRDDEHRFRLFIPLILVYLLLLPLAVLTAAVWLLLWLFPGTGEVRKWMGTALYLPRLLSAARGMEIDVRDRKSDVRFYIR